MSVRFGVQIAREEASAMRPTIHHQTVETHHTLVDKQLVEIYCDCRAQSATTPVAD